MYLHSGDTLLLSAFLIYLKSPGKAGVYRMRSYLRIAAAGVVEGTAINIGIYGDEK